MIYYTPPELIRPKQTEMPVLYYNVGISSSTPLTVKPALAQFQAERALNGMTGLAVDWDKLGAEPPNAIAYQIARSVLSCVFMMGLDPTLVTASVSSGVGICFKQGSIYADIECLNSGEMTTSLINSRGEMFSWEVGQEAGELVSAIQRIQDNINA